MMEFLAADVRELKESKQGCLTACRASDRADSGQRGAQAVFSGLHALLLLPLLVFSAHLLFDGFFAPGLPTGADLGTHFHLAREKFALISETGYWDGLLPHWYLGFSPFTFYPDLFYILFALLKFIFAPVVGDEALFKFLLLATFYLPVLGGYYLVFVLSGSRLFALLGAILILSVSVFSGLGFGGHFGIGLVNQSLGTGLYLFCLGLTICWLNTGRMHYGGLSSAAFVLVIHAHLISLIVCILSLFLLFAIFLWRKRFREGGALEWRRYLQAGLLWGVPPLVCLGSLAYRVIVYWGERGARTGWGDIPLWREIAAGQIFSSGLVNYVAVGVIVVALAFREFRSRCGALLVIGVVLFVLGTGSIRFGGIFDIFNSIFRHRAWGFAGALWMVLCACGLGFIWRAGGGGHPLGGLAARALVVVVSVVCLWSAAGKILGFMPGPRTMANSQFAQQVAYTSLLGRIEREMPKDGVLVYEFGGGHSGTPFVSLASTLAVYGGRVLMQGHQVESSKANFDHLIRRLGLEEARYACDFFSKFGATHFLTWTPHIIEKFEKNPCFRKAFSEGHFHLFAHVRPNFSRASGEGVRVSSYHHSRHQYAWVVHGRDSANTLILSMVHHPRFSLNVNGQPVRLQRTPEQFLTVAVPKGESVVTLTYAIPFFEKLLGYLDKLVAAMALVALAFYVLSPGLRCILARSACDDCFLPRQRCPA